MEEEKKSRYESVMKPTWSMDIMIFARLNDIGKAIDENAYNVERGDMGAMTGWKAALKQYFSAIKYFVKNYFSQEDFKTIMETIAFLDGMMDPISNTVPSSEEEARKAYMMLRLLNDAFYDCTNAVFVKYTEIMNPTVRAANYAFAALPDDEKQKRIQQAIDRDEAKHDGQEHNDG